MADTQTRSTPSPVWVMQQKRGISWSLAVLIVVGMGIQAADVRLWAEDAPAVPAEESTEQNSVQETANDAETHTITDVSAESVELPSVEDILNAVEIEAAQNGAPEEDTAISLPTATLDAEIEADTAQLRRGQTVTYTITITNTSNVQAHQVHVLLVVPTVLSLTSSQGETCTERSALDAHIADCESFNLHAGDDKEISLTFFIENNAPCNELLRAIAIIEANNAQANVGDIYIPIVCSDSSSSHSSSSSSSRSSSSSHTSSSSSSSSVSTSSYSSSVSSSVNSSSHTSSSSLSSSSRSSASSHSTSTSVGCIDLLVEAFDQYGNRLGTVPSFTFQVDTGTQGTTNAQGLVRINGVPTGLRTVTWAGHAGWHQVLVTPAGGKVFIDAGDHCSGIIFKLAITTPSSSSSSSSSSLSSSSSSWSSSSSSYYSSSSSSSSSSSYSSHQSKSSYSSSRSSSLTSSSSSSAHTPLTGCIDVLKEGFDYWGNKVDSLPPFTFRLDNGQTVTSDAHGRARFAQVPAGPRTVTEDSVHGWQQILVTPQNGNVYVNPGSHCSGIVFKNRKTSHSYSSSSSSSSHKPKPHKPRKVRNHIQRILSNAQTTVLATINGNSTCSPTVTQQGGKRAQQQARIACAVNTVINSVINGNSNSTVNVVQR